MLFACGALSRKGYTNQCKITFFTPARGGQCERKSVQNGPRHGSHGPGGGPETEIVTRHEVFCYFALPVLAEGSDLGARGDGGGAIVGFRGSRKCSPGQSLNLGGRCRFGGHFGVDSGVALGSSFGTILARSWDDLRKILGRSSDDLGTIFARSWDGLRKILRRSSQDVKAERGAVTCDSSTRSGCHRPTPSCHMSPLHA